MPSLGEGGEEPSRLIVGGESRVIDATSSTPWTGSAYDGGHLPTTDPQAGRADPGAEAPEQLSGQPPVAEPGPADLEQPDGGVPAVGQPGGGEPVVGEPDLEGPDLEGPNFEEPAASVTRAAQLAAIAAASRSAGESASGNTTVLVRTAVPQGSGPAPVDAGVVYVGSRRTERLTMVVSTVLGTLGLLLALAAAGLDQVRYDQPGPCATYATAHHGTTAFGCTTAAKHLAVFLPAIGIPVLVLLGLVAVWVPAWLPRSRFRLLGVLFLALVGCAIAVGLAYSALPKVS